MRSSAKIPENAVKKPMEEPIERGNVETRRFSPLGIGFRVQARILYFASEFSRESTFVSNRFTR